MKTAIISGITGQDGAYLSRLLLSLNYKVVGLTRKHSSEKIRGLDYLKIADKVLIEECDLLDISQIINLIQKHQPQEIYNLAAQSSVSMSFAQPIGTIQFNVSSVLNLLEAIRIVDPNIKFYQASSSEMYGKVINLPITENTPLHPLSPYAISKATAHWITVNYREAYRLFSCCGVLFNHESYLRSTNFFVKKVIRESLEISNGTRVKLEVGNIEVKRDFGYAPKYVEAIWKVLQNDQPDDYLICSGKSVSLKEVIDYVFNSLGIPSSCLFINPSLYRPTDIEDIYGTSLKARKELQWEYDMSFYQVLDILIEEERDNLKNA